MKRTSIYLLLTVLLLVTSISIHLVFAFAGQVHAALEIPADTLFPGDSSCSIIHPQMVLNNHIVQSDLYTWTSQEQIEQLRNNQPLLIKSQSEKYGKAAYDLVLEAKKAGGDSIAAMLLNDRFAKKRFAWPHPWATVRGYPGENYGDQLLRITFKPEAIFCSFVNGSDGWQPFHFYTTNEKELSLAFVKEHPERIAAVYFVNSRKTTKDVAHYPGTYSRKRKTRCVKTTAVFPYREYVICNEKMIQSWSYGTPGIISVLKDDISYLQFLMHDDVERRNHVISLDTSADDDWKNDDTGTCPYEATVALVNTYYDLNRKQLQTTINVLNNAIKAQGRPFNIINK